MLLRKKIKLTDTVRFSSKVSSATHKYFMPCLILSFLVSLFVLGFFFYHCGVKVEECSSLRTGNIFHGQENAFVL